jgi:hypothetical protein
MPRSWRSVWVDIELSENKIFIFAAGIWLYLTASQSQNPSACGGLRLRFCSIVPAKSFSKSNAIPEKLIYGQAVMELHVPVYDTQWQQKST